MTSFLYQKMISEKQKSPPPRIEIRDGGQSVAVAPSSAGLELETHSSAEDALRTPRIPGREWYPDGGLDDVHGPVLVDRPVEGRGVLEKDTSRFAPTDAVVVLDAARRIETELRSDFKRSADADSEEVSAFEGRPGNGLVVFVLDIGRERKPRGHIDRLSGERHVGVPDVVRGELSDLEVIEIHFSDGELVVAKGMTPSERMIDLIIPSRGPGLIEAGRCPDPVEETGRVVIDGETALDDRLAVEHGAVAKAHVAVSDHGIARNAKRRIFGGGGHDGGIEREQ